MGEDLLPVLLVSSMLLIAGGLVGALWSGRRRSVTSSELASLGLKTLQLNDTARHYGFGIADLEVRIRAARQDVNLLRSEVRIRRATYERLNEELDAQWSEALALKREQTQQEQRIAALEDAILEWKQRLLQLQGNGDRKRQTVEALQQELDAGLKAIDEELARHQGR